MDHSTTAVEPQRDQPVVRSADHDAALCRREAHRHDRTSGDISHTGYRNYPREVARFSRPLWLPASVHGTELCLFVQIWPSRVEATAGGISRNLPARGSPAGYWDIHFQRHEEPNHRWGDYV